MEKIKGNAKTSASWTRLIHKIFEVDPLLCPNGGKAMKIIAFITNHQEIKKIPPKFSFTHPFVDAIVL